MDYKEMWLEMKATYLIRVKKLEEEGKKGSNAYLSAKRFVDVMTKFEISQKVNSEENESDGMDDYHFKRYKEQNA